MSNRVNGRVAIVTGGARGQGAAHGLYLARAGARVILTDVMDEVGAAEAERQRGEGLDVKYGHLDVTKPDDWRELVGRVEREHGKVDVLVNNAGIVTMSPCETCSDDEWDRTIAINQSGVFYGMRAVIPAMKRASGGSIINVSSIFGVRGAAGYAAYVASKHAVVGLTRSGALSCGPDNIRVNVICPGTIDTEMLREEHSSRGSVDTAAIDLAVRRQALDRIGVPDDVAPLVVYLASDESSFVTGAEFVVDAGRLTA